MKVPYSKNLSISRLQLGQKIDYFLISLEEFRDFALSHPEYAVLFTDYKENQTERASVKPSGQNQEHIQLEAEAWVMECCHHGQLCF